MIVTTVDLQANIDKYLSMVNQEDIFITSNGKTIAQMISPRTTAVNSLRGLLKGAPAEITAKTIREERLQQL